MGRARHIPPDAKPTTISLTRPQQIAFQELQLRRLKEGLSKPTLTEVMVEGFQMLLKADGVADADLAKLFPKLTPQRATVRVMPRRGRR
jgi:hypothetical protein